MPECLMSGRLALFRWSSSLSALPGFPNLQPRWNLSPGDSLLLLREQAGQMRADSARWGLTPAWMTDLSRTPAHARAETVAEQPMFRDAFALRRGLVPINGFYEWRGTRKRPYWVSGGDNLLYCAAVWESYPVGEREYLSLALLTCPAADLRRPVLLDAETQREWLDGATPPARLKALLGHPSPALKERALAGLVNDPGTDGPECLTPA